MEFLSSRALKMHKEYLKDIKLKINVFLKSYPLAVGQDIKKIKSLRILPSERETLFRLRCEEYLHELYFSSFRACGERSEKIAREYGSEASFLYRLMRESDGRYGYIIIYTDKSKPKYYRGNEFNILLKIDPLLVVDLCEHAYFLDYGFDREKYLRYALNSLNLSKI